MSLSERLSKALNRPVLVVRTSPRQWHIAARVFFWVVLPLAFLVGFMLAWHASVIDPLLKMLEHAEGMSTLEVYP